MKAEISKLVTLQRLDDEIRALDARLKKMPLEIEALEKEIADERRNLKEAEDRLAEASKQQRARESDLSMTEERLEKYKDQLMNVKSNEEYRAMQKQIEKTKEQVSDIEDAILFGLDTLEELEGARRARQKELETGEKEIAAMEKELESERSRLEEERSRRDGTRQELVKEIPEELLERYRTIARARGGVAMAEATDEHCQVCMVRLRPQVFQELKIGETIHQCDNCKRILYYQAKEEANA